MFYGLLSFTFPSPPFFFSCCRDLQLGRSKTGTIARENKTDRAPFVGVREGVAGEDRTEEQINLSGKKNAHESRREVNSRLKKLAKSPAADRRRG